jgi:hypothetical protein
MLPSRFSRLVGVVLMAAFVACGDPTKPKATTPNIRIDYTVYSLTGSPAAALNAINFFSGATRADAGFSFDVALDIDPSGKVLVYPVRAIAGTLAGPVATRVGLQVVPGAFESVREAPLTGYDTITVKSITIGTTVVAELLDQITGPCIYSLGGQTLFAKFVVDSVSVPTRRLFVRSVLDASCGYRSLVPDSIPTF